MPVSATEWIASASIDAEPVIAKAANFDDRDPEVGEERGEDRAAEWRDQSSRTSHTALVASRDLVAAGVP